MNTLFRRVLLAAVMTFAVHGTASAANTQKQPVTPAIQANEADFQHHYTDVAGQRIHYVTAGKGEPVLLDPWLAADLVYMALCDDGAGCAGIYGDSRGSARNRLLRPSGERL